MDTLKQEVLTVKGHIAILVRVPKEKTDKLAILCPGYLDTKDYPHLTDLAEKLGGIGYTAVSFDPTGTWESGGDIFDYTNTQYLEDIKNVLDFMLKQSSYQQILLGGHSRGGQVSILYAARDPRISKVLGVMPSSRESGKNPEDWKRKGFRISLRDVPGHSTKKEFKVPYAHMLDRNQFDVFEDVKNVHVPIILVAGELDEVVLPEDVKRIFDSANEPKQYICLKNIGHDYRQNPKEIELVNNRIVEVLQGK